MKWYPICLLAILAGCGEPDPRAAGPHPPTELNKRVQANDLAFVMQVKPGDPDLESGKWPNYRPLVEAVMMHQRDMVQVLLEKGASVEADSYGISPMDAAIRSRDSKMVKLLLDHGASVGRKGFGDFPIHTAVKEGNLEILEMILEKGADPNQVSPSMGETPLECAVSRRSFPMAKRLIQAGAKKEVRAYMPFLVNSEPLMKELGIAATERQFDQQQFLRDHPELRPNR